MNIIGNNNYTVFNDGTKRIIVKKDIVENVGEITVPRYE